MDIVEALVAASPYFKTLLKEQDIMIAVNDTKQVRYYSPSNDVDLGLKPGDPIALEDPTIRQALIHGETSSYRIDAQHYGTPSIQHLPRFGMRKGISLAYLPLLTLLKMKKSWGISPR